LTECTILPLQAEQATLDNVGGKGASLARLARAGYPIPGGFLITTSAYLDYVTANHLGDRILQTVATTQPDDPPGLQAASEAIRGWFTEGTIPPDFANALREAYATLGQPPVAARSSATAEDLPEMSFAGQQDTFLNVISDDALLEAVVNCWSSLWTARAIGYRARNGIPHEGVTLAVVVQEMVPAEASGVLFTANPLTGVRTQTVIDATLGLGDALVSGQVEPDHYVVDTAKGEILSKTLGAKAIATRQAQGGGVVTVQEDASRHQALPDEQILQLARLGRRVAGEYNFPQDIEWVWADGQLSLLQSRPITSLYPLPEGLKPEPLRVMVSFAAVQGIVEPMTPLGQDTVRLIFAGGGRLFGFQETPESQQAVRMAGERLWVDITAIVRNSLGRKIVPRVTGLIEPTVGQALDRIWEDPRLAPERSGVRLRTLRQSAPFLARFWRNVLKSWRDPDSRRAQLQKQMEERIAVLQGRSDAIRGAPDEFAQRVGLIHELYDAFPYVVPNVFSAVIGGLVPLAMLNRLASHLPQPGQDGRNPTMEIARGLPHNVTTEMDLCLWETAQTVRSDAPSASRFGEASAQELTADYRAARLPQAAQQAIAGFLERNGMRGLGEIDIGRPRWRQDPTHIMEVIRSYLRIEDKAQAPDVVFQRSAEAAQAASAQLEAAVRGTPGGRLKAGMVRWATRRFRALAGLRESPKLYIVRMMGIIRQGLLESGRDLAAEGLLNEPEDLFFLYLSELEALANHEPHDWAALIASRRGSYAREVLRRQIPRVLLGDGQAFYEGLSAPTEGEEDILVGSPVSPGIVEGVARVVLDPRLAQLAPGDILVCPGTDPAWTPLFLAAGGLVMEVGGMMTHGSVVAREYGIPAVVGVHEATQQLKTGQRVRVDGNTGRVVLLD
jgi:phosphohistidine swiveling domain-containing protein